MPARTGTWWVGVGLMQPFMTLRAELSWTSTFLVCTLPPQAATQFSAGACTNASVVECRVMKPAPQSWPANFLSRLTLAAVFPVKSSALLKKVRALSNLMPV